MTIDQAGVADACAVAAEPVPPAHKAFRGFRFPSKVILGVARCIVVQLAAYGGHRQLGCWPACGLGAGRVAGRDDDAGSPQLCRSATRLGSTFAPHSACAWSRKHHGQPRTAGPTRRAGTARQ